MMMSSQSRSSYHLRTNLTIEIVARSSTRQSRGCLSVGCLGFWSEQLCNSTNIPVFKSVYRSRFQCVYNTYLSITACPRNIPSRSHSCIFRNDNNPCFASISVRFECLNCTEIPLFVFNTFCAYVCAFLFFNPKGAHPICCILSAVLITSRPPLGLSEF